MPKGKLSISEYTVLGIVWRSGPCTTYSIMLTLAGSSSTFYRKRASSTYRVTHRLEEAGLLEPGDEDPGARGDRLIAITPAGIEVLQQWLSPPLSPVEVAHSSDLIRLRMGFLSALDPPAQAALIHDALGHLLALDRDYSEKIAKNSDRFEGLALRGAQLETQARIAWLEEVKAALTSPDSQEI